MQTNRRVLVVDDEEGVRMTLAANLELEGYEVVEAQSGLEALELVQRERFALVISDVRMPGLDGVEMFRAMKKLQPGLTVVLMTAFALEKLIEDGISEGVYTVIYKPFAMDHLIRIVARAVEEHGVLVVDDLRHVADTLADLLQVAGVKAEAAYDGRGALQRIQERTIDVCVLDLVMPEPDGVTTFGEIKRLDRRVAVVAMTGYMVPELIRTIMGNGGYACLRKPFSVDELMRTIVRARGDPRPC